LGLTDDDIAKTKSCRGENELRVSCTSADCHSGKQDGHADFQKVECTGDRKSNDAAGESHSISLRGLRLRAQIALVHRAMAR